MLPNIHKKYGQESCISMDWGYDVAIVTAFRYRFENETNNTKDDRPKDKSNYGEDGFYYYSKTENKRRNGELKATLLGLGYGVTVIDGNYIENYQKTNSYEVSEESLLVVNLEGDKNFKRYIFELSEYYNQDSFLYKPSDSDNAVLVGTNNCDFPGYGKEINAGKFKIDVDSEFFSRVGRKGFAFTNDTDNTKRMGNSKDFKERKVERTPKLETYNQLSRNARWATKLITEQVLRDIKEMKTI